MAINTTSNTRKLNLQESTAAEPFLGQIWNNPEICSNCFAKCKSVVEGSYISRNSGEEHSVEAHHVEENGTTGMADVHPHKASPVHRRRITCDECGSVRLLPQYATLSEREAADRLPALADRLREAGHDVDEDAMRAALHRLKSIPKWETFDKEIFAVTVHVGTIR